MKTFQVHYVTVASTTVTVSVDGDYEDAMIAADRRLPGSLCHQCAHEVELGGDWEATQVYDDKGTLLYEQEPHR